MATVTRLMIIRLFERLEELDAEAHPATSPRTIVSWTREDVDLVNDIAVFAMQHVEPERT